MTRILTVDDSRTQRVIITKELEGAGFEFVEAENGVEGLEKLAAGGIDIVVLDVTMPVMDGPTMLVKMRELGHKTPVVLLTSESKTSLIAPMLQQGVTDYILKPFKPGQLRSKVEKTLGGAPPVGVVAQPPAMGDEPQMERPGRIPAAGKPFVDVLVVDDMENVGRKLRGMLPERISMTSAHDGQSALGLCRERVFRTIILDMEIPDVNSPALASQLRALQPSAATLALVMRTTTNPQDIVREHGFDGFLVKPFDAAQIDEFLSTYYETHDMISTVDNVIKLLEVKPSKSQEERYFKRLTGLTKEAIDAIGAACFDNIIIDITYAPDEERLTRYVVAAGAKAAEIGLSLKLIGSATQQKTIAGIVETSQIPFFDSLEAARKAA